MAKKQENKQIDPNARPLAERLQARWGIPFPEALETVNAAISKFGGSAKSVIDGMIFSDSMNNYREFRRENALKSGQGHKTGSRQPEDSAQRGRPSDSESTFLNQIEGIRPPSKEEFSFPGSVRGSAQEQAPQQPSPSAKATPRSSRGKGKSSARVQETIMNSAFGREGLPSRNPFEFDFDAFNNDIRSKIDSDIKSRSTAGSTQGFSQDDLDLARARTQKNLNRISESLGMAFGLGDAFAARKDRRRAERLRDEISQPTYSVRGPNRTILSELRDAQMRRINPYGQVSPVADQINLGYQQDIDMARNVSGGQASTMGSLSGAAALRRDRNLANLAGAAIGAVGAQDQRIANLAALQSQDDSQRDYLNLYKYNTDLDRAMKEGTSVGQAIASSRLREIQSRNDALNNILGSSAFDVDSYDNLIKRSLKKNIGNQ